MNVKWNCSTSCIVNTYILRLIVVSEIIYDWYKNEQAAPIVISAIEIIELMCQELPNNTRWCTLNILKNTVMRSFRILCFKILLLNELASTLITLRQTCWTNWLLEPLEQSFWADSNGTKNGWREPRNVSFTFKFMTHFVLALKSASRKGAERTAKKHFSHFNRHTRHCINSPMVVHRNSASISMCDQQEVLRRNALSYFETKRSDCQCDPSVQLMIYKILRRDLQR